MATLAFSGFRSRSLFSQGSSVYTSVAARKEEATKFQSINSLSEAVENGASKPAVAEDRETLERAFNLIASILRGLEVDVNIVDASLAKLSPSQREKILAHLQQLKRNKQKTHDLHYRYTELCLADSQEHFTNGVTPRERQLAERIMKLRERIAELISVCHSLMNEFKLLGKLELPRNCDKSLAAIKRLGNVLGEVFGGSFKYFNSAFKITGEQAIFVERNGDVYATDLTKLSHSLEQVAQRLAQVTEGTPIATAINHTYKFNSL